MPKFQKCPNEIRELANEILCEFETHQPLLDAKVTIDFVFAYADEDDAGNKTNRALTKNGVRALGICRKIPTKDRALGRADAEIALDGDWWAEANEAERRALLDHELYHIAIRIDKRGLVRDDLGRPALQLRKHDYEFGWFREVAARHGMFSQERKQAADMLEESGQYFWPDFLANTTSEEK